MGRLINADMLMLDKDGLWVDKGYAFVKVESLDDIPTAYDVEAVLTECKARMCNNQFIGSHLKIIDAICRGGRW